MVSEARNLASIAHRYCPVDPGRVNWILRGNSSIENHNRETCMGFARLVLPLRMDLITKADSFGPNSWQPLLQPPTAPVSLMEA